MSDNWYVWVVGHYSKGGYTGPEDECRFYFVGVFTSHEKARAAAYQGCAIFPMVIDEAWALGDASIQNVEWIE